MAKDFARKFKKLVSAQVEGQSDNLIGTVLSVHPIEISCHGGQWLLTADDLQISNHVSLHTGDSVVLSGEDPFSVISVLSDADPDEYEPPESLESMINAVSEKAERALSAAGTAQDTADSAVFGITLGNSTKPLTKINGTVNIPLSVAASGGMRFERIGNLVLMSQAGDAWGTIGSITVPDGYRPKERKYCLGAYADTSWKAYFGRMAIYADGSITIHSLSGTTWVAQTDGYFVGSCAWLTD